MDTIENQENKLLSPTEVAEIFKCHITTVHNWTKKGLLKKYGIGNRVYYKLHEVLASLITL